MTSRSPATTDRSSNQPVAHRVVGRAGGSLLSGATRAVALARPSRKPLHPRGLTVEARIFRHGRGPSTGVPWLDEPGRDDVIVRRSRAVGLPRPVPDIIGLAIRVPVPPTQDNQTPGHADLLMASTGWGRLGRFTLAPVLKPPPRALTTLLPYRAPTGPVMLGAQPVGPDSYRLSWAAATQPWHHFADLRLSHREVPDEISFDPVLHQLPHLHQYALVEALREPAYRRARSSRR